jgi:nickel-dependent lactate racemase
MIIKVPYGCNSLQCAIPDNNLVGVYEAKDLPVPDQEQTIRQAIENPIAQARIRDIAMTGRKALIISDDITRKTPVKKILPMIVSELNHAGIPDDDIKILVAPGTHIPMSKGETVEKFGEEMLERVDVLNHNSHEKSCLNFLGKTKTGIPIWVNKELSRADIKIGVGSIFPHRVSGFGGGSKIVGTGVSGVDTIGATHINSAKFNCGQIMGIRDNSIRQEMDDIAQTAGLTTIFNTVLDKQGRILKAFSGDFRSAFRVGADFDSQIANVEIPNHSDIVITDAHPYESDFWSSGEKGLTAGELAVKKGGTIIFAHPCHEGLKAGPAEEEFLSLMSLSRAKIVEKVEKSEVRDLVAAATAMMINEVNETAQVIMISDGMSDDTTSRLGFQRLSTLEQAVEKAFKTHGKDAKVSVLRHGSELVPKVIGR